MPYFKEVLFSHWYMAVPLGGLVFAFIAFFLAPSFFLMRRLNQFSGQIISLKKSQSDPKQLKIIDERLNHLWDEYCETLHLPQAAINPRTGLANGILHRATVPAEFIFNSQSVFEGRISAEFFKHLPGLLTGIGIIGTFLGLIDGLGDAFVKGKPDPALLIAPVRGAFNISAVAIILAMVVTFFEKVILSHLHSRVEKLCQNIDSLYSAGAGEEYLARLVSASEELASQAKILKDALVGDLSEILERLAQKQIDAADHNRPYCKVSLRPR